MATAVLIEHEGAKCKTVHPVDDAQGTVSASSIGGNSENEGVNR